MLSEDNFEIIMAIFAVSFTIIFIISNRKRRDLRPWMIIFILVSLSISLIPFSQVYILMIIRFLLYSIGFFVISIVIVFELSQTLSKEGTTPKNLDRYLKLILINQLLLSLFYFLSFENLFPLILFVINDVILFFIYKKKKNLVNLTKILTNSFLLATVALSTISHFYTLPPEIDFASFFLFLAAILLFSIVVPLETKIIRAQEEYRLAYNRLVLYKDLLNHDINNNYQIFLLSLNLIQKYQKTNRSGEKIDEIINLMRENVYSGMHKNKTMELLSKLEEEQIETRPIDLKQYLDESIELTKKTYYRKNIKIDLNYPREKISVLGNKLLQDIFKNIIENSILHNNNPIKEIIINIIRTQKELVRYVLIEFIDNGKGISEELRKLLIECNFDNPQQYKRLGLGLILVNEIVKVLDGKISIKSRIPEDYQKGSIVQIYLKEI